MPKILPVDINEKTVVLNLECGRIVNNHKIDVSNVETEIDKSMLSVSVELFDAPELRACQNFQAQLKKKILKYVVPSFLRGGMYRVKYEAIEIVDKMIVDAAEEFSALVKAFADVVEKRRDESEERLGPAFNPNAYPSKERILSQYRITHSWLSFNTPDSLKSIQTDIFKRERDKVAAQVEAAARGVTAMLAAEAKELGDHLVERLTPNLDGKPKQIRKSAVNNIKEFLDTFQFRNIGTSDELDSQVERIKQLVDGVDADALRSSDDLKQSLAKGFKSVSKALDELIVESPRRFMDIGNDS